MGGFVNWLFDIGKSCVKWELEKTGVKVIKVRLREKEGLHNWSEDYKGKVMRVIIYVRERCL